MITIQTRNDLFIQIHKNQVAYPIEPLVRLDFTGFNDKVVSLYAQVQTLTNCYLVQVSDAGALASLGLNATMTVTNEEFGFIGFKSNVQLFIPAPLPQNSSEELEIISIAQ